ncbi:MAG: TIGR04376 family protein [Cyanobacteria bacterium P01_H01_bin.121]
MGLFDDVSQFLETRLEEFLRDNPHLELLALDDQLREQAEESLRLVATLKRQEQALQEKILATARDIQRWHERIQKAKAVGRRDLVEPAEAREAALLRQGNQLWGQMRGVQTQAEQTQTLYKRVQARRQEVKAKLETVRAQQATTQASQSWQTQGWQQATTQTPRGQADPLEAKFQQWETEAELQDLKRQMGQ